MPICKISLQYIPGQLSLFIAQRQDDMLGIKIFTEDGAPKAKGAVGQDVMIGQSQQDHIMP